MGIPGNLLTTAMAVMPHRDPDRALQTALELDIPFWPQLPLLSYYEDMYVQAAEHFPGIILDTENRRLAFSMQKFLSEVEETMEHFEGDPAYFDISPGYSAVYHRFLELNLADRAAIRGQIEGPISFGFNIQDVDEERPILFNDTVRPFLLEFMARRVNVQLHRLKQRNAHAFMFVDEPGLEFIFNAMSGYGDVQGRQDLEYFFSLIERPRGIHLCGNPDWDFLLRQDLDVLSLDVFTNGERFTSYTRSIQDFLHRGGTLIWGMVPTNAEPFEQHNLDTLERTLEDLWQRLLDRGIDWEQLISSSLLSPATCCLVNPDGTRTVEQAFQQIKALSLRLREKHKLA